MKIENVKGGYNYLPKEQNIRNYINNILVDTFKEYGYESIETPILTYYDILSDKYDENNDLLKEIYRLKDQGNRDLGLRYDLTVPFAKLIALNKNKIKYPFKRYEIAKVFRDGPVKVGRDREFTQCDVDVVGIKDISIEAELLCLYISAFNKLDIDIIIKYNNRKLMKGIILESGIDENLLSKVITIIDKMNKLSLEQLNNLFIDIGLTENNIKNLNKYFNLSIKKLSKLFRDTSNTILREGIDEINKLNEYIDKLNINKYVKLDLSLARGQDYYTGTVFEVYEANNRLSSSIGGGGRYDNMITNFINDGNIYPAVGISFGLTSLYELMKDKKIDNNIDILIIPMNTKIESLIIANKFRNMGYKVDIDNSNRKLKKIIESASKSEIKYIIVIGEDEINKGSFNIKNMLTGEIINVKINDIETLKI